MSTETRVETKEERKARKEAKKAAKAAAASAQADGSIVDEPVGPATSESAEGKKEKKEKKEKKRKAEDTAKAEAPNDTVNTDADAEASEKKRRKEEKRAAKRKAEADGVTATATATAGDGASGASSSAAQTSGIGDATKDKKDKKEKKEKKDKKRKRTEEVAADEGAERYSPSVPVAQPEAENEAAAEPGPSISDGAAPTGETSTTAKPPKRPKRSKLEKQQAAEAAAKVAAEEEARRKADGSGAGGDEAEPAADAEVLEGAYGDEALTESAKKALAYCEQYVASHATPAEDISDNAAAKWKFQKAKQNWLVKHFWDDAEVPDAYVDVVVTYLKTIQGGGRKGLIDAAKKRRDAPIPIPTPVEAAPATAAAAEVDGQADSSASAASAHTGVELAPASQTAENAEAAESAQAAPAVDEEAVRKHGLAKVRAERLLKAMGAR